MSKKILAVCFKCRKSTKHTVVGEKATCADCQSSRKKPSNPLVFSRGYVMKQCSTCFSETSHELIDQSLRCVWCGRKEGIRHDL